MKSGSGTDVPTHQWHWNEEVTIASPPGVGCFRASMEYTHGGISLQEMVTPVLRISRGGPSGDAARLVEGKWTGAKCRIAVSGECAGFSVDLRTQQADPGTSLLANQHAVGIPTDGKVAVFLDDDGDIGKQAEIVLLDQAGKVVDSLPTTLGE